MSSFTGMYAPTFAPLNADGSLNVKLIPTYAEHLMKTGLKGILVNATSGEGMSLTVRERKTLAEGWMKICKDRPLTVIIMVGAGCLKDTQELAAHAEELGADAIATLPCLFDKPATVEDLVEYCLEVSKMAPKTPLLYYHVPFKTNVNLPMDQFLREGGQRINTLAGLKFTSHDVEEGLRCVRLYDGKFAVFSGFDEELCQSLVLGYKCAINCCFNFLATEAAKIFALVIDGRKRQDDEDNEWLVEAKKQQEIIDKTLQQIYSFTGGFSVASLKCAMKIITGIDVGPPRKPIKTLSEASQNEMEIILRNRTALKF